MFGSKRSEPQQELPPSWNKSEWTQLSNLVVKFPPWRELRDASDNLIEVEEFGTILVRYLEAHPELEVAAMTGLCCARFGTTTEVIVVFKERIDVRS